MKRMFAVLLSVLLLICLIPSSVFAGSGWIAVVDFDADLSPEGIEGNREKILQYTASAVQQGAFLVLFPEYALNYGIENAIDPENSEAVDEICSCAVRYGVYILFGAATLEDGEYYSALLCCGPGGTLTEYRKIHLTDEEFEAGFSAGDAPVILSTGWGSFGVMMGSEFRNVPELSKYYLYSGCCTVLCADADYVSAGDSLAREQEEYAFYVSAYAFEYMYGAGVAYANLFTETGERSYIGGSHVCSDFASGFSSAGTVNGSCILSTEGPGVTCGSVHSGSGLSFNYRRPEVLTEWYTETQSTALPDYGPDSEYSDTVRVASVNFHPVWGDVDANLTEIRRLMKEAHEDGVELLVFPELALTGYSVCYSTTCSDELRAKIGSGYMQTALAKVVRGSSPDEDILELQELAASYGMIVVLGLPERDENDSDLVYNSVAILGENLRQTYRKVNPVAPETYWCTAGDSVSDAIFETPFGYVGVGICADIYHYQELQRNCALRGCRICINCTAGAGNDTTIPYGGWQLALRNRLESFMLRDGTCMISSNLVGYDGPDLTSAGVSFLASYGETADSLDSSDLTGLSSLCGLLFSSSEDGSSGVLPSGSTIFPGCSVVLSPDAGSSSGFREVGNTSASSEIYGSGRYATMMDPDGDGFSSFVAYSADTFNTFYADTLDLSGCLSMLTSNPTACRTGLYAQWYSLLYLKRSESDYTEMTLTDEATGITLSGTLLEGAELSVEEVSEESGLEYLISVTANDRRYGEDVSVWAADSTVQVTLGVSEDVVACLADGEEILPENGTVSFETTLSGTVRLVLEREPPQPEELPTEEEAGPTSVLSASDSKNSGGEMLLVEEKDGTSAFLIVLFGVLAVALSVLLSLMLLRKKRR